MIEILSALLFAAQPVAVASEPCTEDEAIPTTVVEIATDPDRFLDRCVTVTGAVAGVSMYSGREGMYLAFRYGTDGNYSAESRLHRIGIDRQDIRNLRLAFPRQTTVTGRVDSCERRFDRVVAAGGIPFLGGYCHYFSGPTIMVDSYAITERRHERMTGETARARYGNLAFMPDDWPGRPGAEAIVAEFLTALRTGNREKLAELHDFDDENNEYQRGVLSDLLTRSHSPFAEARLAEPSQVAFFVSMAGDGSLLSHEGMGSASTVCLCRTNDCTGLWPISLNDANNAPDRPYACTFLQANEHGPAWLVTPDDGGWLTEPAATAFASR